MYNQEEVREAATSYWKGNSLGGLVFDQDVSWQLPVEVPAD